MTYRTNNITPTFIAQIEESSFNLNSTDGMVAVAAMVITLTITIGIRISRKKINSNKVSQKNISGKNVSGRDINIKG